MKTTRMTYTAEQIREGKIRLIKSALEDILNGVEHESYKSSAKTATWLAQILDDWANGIDYPKMYVDTE